MKYPDPIKNRRTIWLAILLFVFGCNFLVVVKGQWEDAELFKVEPDIKPSQLISHFTGDSSYLTKKNYFLTFYDIYCGFSYQQIDACNMLYDSIGEDYEWIAITIYDSVAERKYRKKLNLPSEFRYKYRTYYKINGLRSSLRNLYYRNQIPNEDISPMNMIIVNDSIFQISRGAINTREKFLLHLDWMLMFQND